MARNDLQQLEDKIDRLIAVCEHLQAENQSLREREANLLKERGRLVEKNETARSRVEAMITRLKNLEVDN